MIKTTVQAGQLNEEEISRNANAKSKPKHDICNITQQLITLQYTER